MKNKLRWVEVAPLAFRAMPGWTLESAIAPIAHIFDGDTVAAMDFLVGYRNDRTENKKSG